MRSAFERGKYLGMKKDIGLINFSSGKIQKLQRLIAIWKGEKY